MHTALSLASAVPRSSALGPWPDNRATTGDSGFRTPAAPHGHDAARNSYREGLTARALSPRRVPGGIPLARLLGLSGRRLAGRSQAMIQQKAAAIGRAGLRGIRRHWIIISVPIALVLIAAYAIAFMLDEPLRRYTEEKM